MDHPFQIEVDFSFQAARRLLGLAPGHPCGRRHGNTFVLTVALQGPLDPAIGWVQDFDAIARAVRPVLDRVDHRDLNEDLPELGNPTSERIARFLFEALRPALPGLSEIRLSESPTTRCIYRGQA